MGSRSAWRCCTCSPADGRSSPRRRRGGKRAGDAKESGTLEGGGRAMSKILLRGGRVIDPSQSIDQTADVLIAGGAIEAVGARVAGQVATEQADTEVIDCAGL